MPYRSETGGFTGGGNMGDFIDQIVETFLTDAKSSGGLGWISHVNNGSPVRGKGSSPDFEFLFSRGGSPAQVQIWGMQTNSKTLRIYSGNGIDTTAASFDQPGNPVNEPPADPPSDQTSGTVFQERCQGVTTAVGPYDGYWVFGGDTGQYCHVVLKVNSREYRHFHVGLIEPLDNTLDPSSFYVTGHRWTWLSPDNLKSSTNETTNTNSKEHQPYAAKLLPFSNNLNNNTAVGHGIRSCTWVYSPNYGTAGFDWWLMTGNVGGVAPGGGGGGPTVTSPEIIERNQPASAVFTNYPVKTVGVVNTNGGSPLDVRFGCGTVSGYGDALGSIPWGCEPTFTTDGVALIPIYFLLPSDFESGWRWAPIGRVPDVFRVNMKSLDAEQEISIGSDTYTVFPMINKDANNTVAGEGYSGYEGLAYKKITANAT